MVEQSVGSKGVKLVVQLVASSVVHLAETLVDGWGHQLAGSWVEQKVAHLAAL